jgi:hypothetical protein
MGQSIRFENTALQARGKQGKIKKAPSGYYENVIVGGWGIHNGAGQYYSTMGVKDWFCARSPFMQYVRDGYLKGENGHPRREPGMNDTDWLRRVRTVVEDNVACHYKKIELVDNLVIDPKTGKKALGVVVDVCPSGPGGDAFERSMDNPHENVAFSVRTITNDSIRPSEWIKYLKHLTTWDVVTIPGIHDANKYDSPSMEAAQLIDLDPYEMSQEDFLRAVTVKQNTCGVSMESGEREALADLYHRAFGGLHQDKPNWLAW